MAVAIPQLDVYYIEFVDEANAAKVKKFYNNEPVVAGAKTAVELAPLWIAGAMFPVASLLRLLLNLGLSLSPDIVRSLKRLFANEKFHIIESQEELRHFVNANGNEWVVNHKALKQKQYYIRHPKKLNRNVLVEAKFFYDYIEEEQKDELIDYIMSHCSAKSIQIDRIEAIGTHGKAKVKVKGADMYAEVNYDRTKGNYYSYFNPNGSPHTTPRDNYFWIDKSIMRSIDALSESASMTQTYECDFTFGLTVGEAKTIGLDISKHKKYSYSIHIEC